MENNVWCNIVRVKRIRCGTRIRDFRAFAIQRCCFVGLMPRRRHGFCYSLLLFFLRCIWFSEFRVSTSWSDAKLLWRTQATAASLRHRGNGIHTLIIQCEKVSRKQVYHSSTNKCECDHWSTFLRHSIQSQPKRRRFSRMCGTRRTELNTNI